MGRVHKICETPPLWPSGHIALKRLKTQRKSPRNANIIFMTRQSSIAPGGSVSS